jgi:hypothetical protein
MFTDILNGKTENYEWTYDELKPDEKSPLKYENTPIYAPIYDGKESSIQTGEF